MKSNIIFFFGKPIGWGNFDVLTCLVLLTFWWIVKLTVSIKTEPKKKIGYLNIWTSIKNAVHFINCKNRPQNWIDKYEWASTATTTMAMVAVLMSAMVIRTVSYGATHTKKPCACRNEKKKKATEKKIYHITPLL